MQVDSSTYTIDPNFLLLDHLKGEEALIISSCFLQVSLFVFEKQPKKTAKKIICKYGLSSGLTQYLDHS